ncbi:MULTISPECIES: lysophospholipid acyltransferase family protein [Pseudomonadaceae]|uniref:1-acyl-sn-glycerol-3-phosphate acyltransferase n=2 Tax=Ectopseudomonas mendocina TaxID=300 RepID=A0ABD7RTH3_ECTME|nr:MULTISPECIES: lysophospholipid acyltransferase family protein [Pseudomonas]AEB56659.1 acyltransferase family protein [Pseudomonas mendocina NK-01]ALN20938.1 acyltransferase [Pseudomonas mendocina S5.2]MDF2076107.1 lysophospholipid acyltransferase family protein [Pseudomonas mendocina]PKQ41486.1 1-acyl-sn-glycerol-3-phosphate acyltransferase [Pseudomonas sp. YY-1]QTN43935.1 1-acyl-sn-glycerol-3-phosphate acyltransferase [Pseudomonas mendocina]
MSFALFGVGGVLLRVLVFPVLGLLPGDVLQRRTRARAVVSWTFRVFVQFMFRTGVLTYEVEGAERLGRPGQMVIANHPSLIDVVVLIAFIRDANCVVKQSLWENPCMRGPIRAAQYISNSGSMDMLDEAAGALQSGETLIIFPEGTRTVPGTNPEFHRGAAAIAVRGASVVTPVVISVTPTTLTKAEPWYSIPSRRFHFRLRVGEDIDPRQFTEQAPLPIASRKLNDHLHQHFMKELASDERSAT